MANTQYLKPNRLMSELEEQQIKRQKRKIKYAFGFALLALILGELYVDVYAGAVVAVILFFLITRDTKTIADAQLESGAQGENDAIEILSKLDNTHALFNQIKIPHKHAVDGKRECDVIVVAENAVYVVEVKNQRGLISAKLDYSEWEVVKKIKHNQTKQIMIANPVTQVKAQAQGLAQWLEVKGVTVPVIPIVFFVHKDVAVNGVAKSDIAVVTRENVLKAFTHKGEGINSKAVIMLLESQS